MPISSIIGGYKMQAWNCNATTSKLEVVGNLWHRYDNSSPRYSVRTTMPSLVPSLKFPYVSNLQDKHTASNIFQYVRKESPQSVYKSR